MLDKKVLRALYIVTGLLGLIGLFTIGFSILLLALSSFVKETVLIKEENDLTI